MMSLMDDYLAKLTDGYGRDAPNLGDLTNDIDNRDSLIAEHAQLVTKHDRLVSEHEQWLAQMGTTIAALERAIRLGEELLP